jgi:hypothetical protein
VYFILSTATGADFALGSLEVVNVADVSQVHTDSFGEVSRLSESLCIGAYIIFGPTDSRGGRWRWGLALSSGNNND